MTILGCPLIVRLSNVTYVKTSMLREYLGKAVLDLPLNRDVIFRDIETITSKLNL
jgi:hypothetical protein